MQYSRRTLIAVATATAAATGAIGVITGASGASNSSKPAAKATAAKDCGPRGPWGHRGGPIGISGDQLDKIAGKLGVETDKLQTALDTVREGAGDDRRQSLADALAKALGVDAAKVLKILDDNAPQPPAAGRRPQRPDGGRLVTALASGLGVSEDKVSAALKTLRGERRDRARPRGDLMTKLAAELGLDESKVTAAFKDVLGRPGAMRGPGARGAWGHHGRRQR